MCVRWNKKFYLKKKKEKILIHKAQFFSNLYDDEFFFYRFQREKERRRNIESLWGNVSYQIHAYLWKKLLSKADFRMKRKKSEKIHFFLCSISISAFDDSLLYFLCLPAWIEWKFLVDKKEIENIRMKNYCFVNENKFYGIIYYGNMIGK